MRSDKIAYLLEQIAVALQQIAAEIRNLHQSPNGDSQEVSTEEAQTSDLVETESLAPSFLETFLSSRKIAIKSRAKEEPADKVIDSLSLFLGEHYDALSSLLAKIKRAMQHGMPITESVRDLSQRDISAVCQFCTRLHEIAFLEQYQYLRSPAYLIKAKPTTLPIAQRFFGGQWLERFVLLVVKAVFERVASEVEAKPGFEYLINPQITLPNGDDFELDVLVAIGSFVYWIEATTGDYQQHIAKYSRFAKLLGLDVRHSFMVLPDVAAERCATLSDLFSMTVCNLGNFEEKFLASVRADISAS